MLLTNVKSYPFYEETDPSIHSGLIFTSATISVTYDPSDVPLLWIQRVSAQKWTPTIALDYTTIKLSLLYIVFAQDSLIYLFESRLYKI